MIKAPKPSIGPHFVRYRRSSTGMRNASVLPEPVLAAPRTSLPKRDNGREDACMGVNLVKCAAFNPKSDSVFYTQKNSGATHMTDLLMFSRSTDIGRRQSTPVSGQRIRSDFLAFEALSVRSTV